MFIQTFIIRITAFVKDKTVSPLPVSLESSLHLLLLQSLLLFLQSLLLLLQPLLLLPQLLLFTKTNPEEKEEEDTSVSDSDYFNSFYSF